MTDAYSTFTRRAALSTLAAAAATPALAQQQRRQTQPQNAAAPAGEVRHALTVGPIKARLRSPPAPEFDVWGVEGQTPARPLRMKLGQTALVTLNNRTDQPLALHWQGVRGHGAIDAPGGFAAEPVAPGASFEYRLTPLDAGVSLFRPLVAGRSGELQDRGVAGALIVEEAKPPQADADIVLVIDDWLLTDDNKVSPFEPA